MNGCRRHGKTSDQKLGGWATYFNLGPVTPAYRFLDRYTTTRLRRWLGKKHKQSSGRLKRYPDEFLYQQRSAICRSGSGTSAWCIFAIRGGPNAAYGNGCWSILPKMPTTSTPRSISHHRASPSACI